MNNIIEQIKKNECYGCAACLHICSYNAISMKNDDKGFLYPTIDKALCVNCGLCTQACPVKNEKLEKKTARGIYGVVNNDEEERLQSTSGGLFSLIADYYIKNRGAIYGAIFKNGEIKHIRVTEDYSAMRGAKYSQSNLDGVYNSISSDLKRNTLVFFVGTPCQCAALKLFLSAKRINTKNLTVVDFICHGVVSPLILHDYIFYAEKKANKKILMHIFRDKIKGWNVYTESNVFEDGTVDNQSYESQLYKRFFLSNMCLRESCYTCKFATKDRVGDITMGDFWGLDKSHPEKFDKKGVSFAMINSEKGIKIFDLIKDKMNYFPVNIEDTTQPHLTRSVSKSKEYDAFWKDYSKGFNYVVVKRFHGGKIRRLISIIYNKLRVTFKK
jgi:4Fe-4S ferredoxin, iron-sulfur binding domain protein